MQGYRHFLGIDESGHHAGSPLIYAGVYSTDVADIRPDSRGIKKRRMHVSPFGALMRRKAGIVYIDDELRAEMNGDDIKGLALGTLIRAYSPLDMVIFDGYVNGRVLSAIELVLGTTAIPQMLCESRADERYSIVNVADMVAIIAARAHEARAQMPQVPVKRVAC